MTYATLQRFEAPERLILMVAEPQRATVRMDVRVAGLGAEGRHRYIETEDGRRIRRDTIRSVSRPGGGAVDLDAAIRGLQGLPPAPEDHNSFGSHMQRLWIGLGLALAAGGVAVVLYVLADGALMGPEAWEIGLLVVTVPILVVGLWAMRRAWRDIRSGFGKDGRE